MTPVVSVCIANFNGIDIIDDCIESIRQQDFDLPVEIIVHDDASTDGSAEHVRTDHHDVRLIESSENVGFCVANNRMAAVARGEYLLLLNNDAALMPDALITLYQAVVATGRPAILGLPQYDAETGEFLDNGSLLDPFLNPVPNRDLDRHNVGMIMGACLWIPLCLWEELGGVPEWFGSIGEDLYLCCRARLFGYPSLALGRSGYHHKVGSSFGGGKVRNGKLSTTQKRRALSERNKSFVMATCYPIAWLLALLPLHLVLLAVEGLCVSLIKHDARIWTNIYGAALSSLWKQRRRLLDTRRQMQRSRRAESLGFLHVFTPVPYKLRMLLKHGVPEIR